MSTIQVNSLTEAWEVFQQDLQEAERDIMNDVLEELKSKTPVNTGTARDGWKLDSDTEISNDVEYIGYLEMGTINNPPIGMVSTTILEVDSIVNRVMQNHNI